MNRHLSLISILIVISFSVYSQNLEFYTFNKTPCDEGYDKDRPSTVMMTYEELIEAYSKLNRTINLFENYDFENEDYEIIYTTEENGQNFYYHVSSVDELNALKNEYQLDRPVFNNLDSCIFNDRIYILLEDGKNDYFYVNWNCQLISTECGEFEFDPSVILNSGAQCYSDDCENKFYNKKELKGFIDKIENDDNLISYSVYDFYEGYYDFIYVDSSEFINKVLNDTFYLEVIKNQLKEEFLSKNYSEEDFYRLASKVGDLGLIMGSVIDKEMGFEAGTLEAVEIVKEKTQYSSYKVTMSVFSKSMMPKKRELRTLISKREQVIYDVCCFWKRDDEE